MKTFRPPSCETPLSSLERVYLEEYLRSRGVCLMHLHRLPNEEARALMVKASIYASNKLAEIELRAAFIHEIHGECI